MATTVKELEEYLLPHGDEWYQIRYDRQAHLSVLNGLGLKFTEAEYICNEDDNYVLMEWVLPTGETIVTSLAALQCLLEEDKK